MKSRLVAAALALLAGCSSPQRAPIASTRDAQIFGQWRSVEIGDGTPSPQVKAVAYEFRPNGSFTLIQHMEGGTKVKSKGSYVTESKIIRLTVTGDDTASKTYTVNAELLEIRGTNDWVVLQRPLKATKYKKAQSTTQASPSAFWDLLKYGLENGGVFPPRK